MVTKSQSDAVIFSEETELKRDLGLLETISIVIGRIIGSGIFRTPAPIMAAVLCTSIFGFVWLLGGLVTIFGAVCYAELVAMMPKSGGPYVYLKVAYGNAVAFLRGWAMFFVSETASIAAVALVFAEYFSSLWAIIYGVQLDKIIVILVALFAIWALTLINCFGVYFSGIIQNFFSSIKVIAVFAIIGLSFTAQGNSSNFATPFLPSEFNWNTILGIGIALKFSFFAFSGWEGATYVAEEVKNPRKNLPLSLIFGICGVMVLYFGANAAYLYQLPPSVIAESDQVATTAMVHAVGGFGGILIAIAVMMNTFGNVSTQILCKARTWQAMAHDGLFFDKFAVIHDKYKTPNNAMLFQGLWASVLLLFAAIAENSYDVIISFFAANGTIFNILTFLSVFILRKKYPDANRPFKAWFYPYSLIIIIIIYIAFLILTLITAFLPSMAGLALTSTGLIYYFWKIHKRKE